MVPNLNLSGLDTEEECYGGKSLPPPRVNWKFRGRLTGRKIPYGEKGVEFSRC